MQRIFEIQLEKMLESKAREVLGLIDKHNLQEIDNEAFASEIKRIYLDSSLIDILSWKQELENKK